MSDDKVLVDRRESEVAGAAGQEWKSVGDQALVLEETVETFLLAFLADHRRDSSGGTIITVLGEDEDKILKSAEDDISKLGSESNGIVEVVNTKRIVGAWLNDGSAKGLISLAGVQGMKLLLCENGCNDFDNKLLLGGVLYLVTRYVGCNVVQQVGKEGHLEFFVELEELEVYAALGAERWRWRGVRESTVCEVLDCLQLLAVWVWKAVIEEVDVGGDGARGSGVSGG